MTDQLTSLQCPSCGGLLRSLDARVWQCAYCESKYMLLGEADPELGMVRVADGTSPDDWTCRGPVSELEAAQWKARMAIDDFNRKFPIPRPVQEKEWDGVARWKGEAWKQAAAMRGVLDLTGCGPLSEVQVAALKEGMLRPPRPKEVLYVTQDSPMRTGAEA